MTDKSFTPPGTPETSPPNNDLTVGQVVGPQYGADKIRERHEAWYDGDDSTAEWHDELDFVETYQQERDWTPRKAAMAHEIVRVDILRLLAAVEAVAHVHQAVRADVERCVNCRTRFPCPTITALSAALGSDTNPEGTR